MRKLYGRCVIRSFPLRPGGRHHPGGAPAADGRGGARARLFFGGLCFACCLYSVGVMQNCEASLSYLEISSSSKR